MIESTRGSLTALTGILSSIAPSVMAASAPSFALVGLRTLRRRAALSFVLLLGCNVPGDDPPSDEDTDGGEAGGTSPSGDGATDSPDGTASGGASVGDDDGGTAEPDPDTDTEGDDGSESGGSAGEACDPPPLSDGWQPLTPTGSIPPARHSHALAHDVARGRTVLFGGLSTGYNGDESSLLGDTWEWDGCAWIEIDVDGPSSRQGHTMVYDDALGVVLLFGGNGGGNGGGSSNELWQYDGASWELVSSGGPPPRWKHGMAYDSDRDVVVVFGGESGSKDDLWEWDGAQWTMVGAAGPAGRSRLGLVYDPQRQETILFGGRLASGQAAGDTWAWDGSTWEPRQDVGAQGWGRSRHGMVYDGERGVIVVFGGLSGPYRNDTLEWDGTEWTQPVPLTQGSEGLPSARIYAGLVYDTTTASTLLFGGFDGDPMQDDPIDDTWAYRVDR